MRCDLEDDTDNIDTAASNDGVLAADDIGDVASNDGAEEGTSRQDGGNQREMGAGELIIRWQNAWWSRALDDFDERLGGSNTVDVTRVITKGECQSPS